MFDNLFWCGVLFMVFSFFQLQLFHFITEVFVFVKLQSSFLSIIPASLYFQLPASIPVFPPSHFQCASLLLTALLLCKSIPCSLCHGLEGRTGESIFMRCLFFSLMWTLCFPNSQRVLRDETPACVCWASNILLSPLPQPRPASSPRRCLMPWAGGCSRADLLPRSGTAGQALPAMLLLWGCSWPLRQLVLVPPGLHAWRMGEARLVCWLVAHLWALFLPGFQHWWQEKFPLEAFSLKRFTICFSNLFWLV